VARAEAALESSNFPREDCVRVHASAHRPLFAERPPGVRTGDPTGALLVAGVDLVSGLAMIVLCAAVGNAFLGSLTRDQDRG